jgi:hypothetical protein
LIEKHSTITVAAQRQQLSSSLQQLPAAAADHYSRCQLLAVVPVLVAPVRTSSSITNSFTENSRIFKKSENQIYTAKARRTPQVESLEVF